MCSSESLISLSSAKGAAALVNLLTLLHIHTETSTERTETFSLPTAKVPDGLQKLSDSQHCLSWRLTDSMTNANDAH